jgi:hypothetical protein
VASVIALHISFSARSGQTCIWADVYNSNMHSQRALIGLAWLVSSKISGAKALWIEHVQDCLSAVSELLVSCRTSVIGVAFSPHTRVIRRQNLN